MEKEMKRKKYGERNVKKGNADKNRMAYLIRKQKRLSPRAKPLLCMAHSGGFEPPTAWFVAEYSIQLSYECVVEARILWALYLSVKHFFTFLEKGFGNYVFKIN